jgi:hypothetical protein
MKYYKVMYKLGTNNEHIFLPALRELSGIWHSTILQIML